jgi:hypothetical protein
MEPAPETPLTIRERWALILPVVWVVAVFFTVPIGADRFRCPSYLKVIITIGHSVAAWSLLYTRKPSGCGCLSALGAAYTILAMFVLWFWNR